ncbi:MAG: HAMP domain-containing histidine kinase [Actinomycetota bacterium]|nr:HAMP domain-containing histidine kinase [Actinomycetota bacterium]
MLRSLRFRLPALFLIGIVLAGVVAAGIAVGLFQDYFEDRTRTELRREARGLAKLYAEQAIRAIDEDRAPAPFATAKLEQASGNRLFYVGGPIQLKGAAVLPELPQRLVPQWRTGRVQTFEFVPPGARETYLAVAHPLRLEGRVLFGALVVATPKAELRDRWVTLMERLALAFLVGIAVAGALTWYLSRRITDPVLALSSAADEIARGNYRVAVPDVPGGGEIGDLADRFREMATRLSEAEELERNFLMSVSHELRTPLTAIRGHVEALREGLVDDPDVRARSLDVVAAEAARLERLVGDVLDLAKLDTRRFTLHREEVDMGRLLERAYSTFGEEARRRRIDYRAEVAVRPVIVSDGDRVLQIISNLLANAFRWTPDGGSVELALSEDNGSVAVAVADSGPGIPPDERERIFRPFFTRDGGGTGLGLAIARELALALGGRLDVDSEPGRGSRFELLLPARPTVEN